MADANTNPYLALLQQEDKPPSLAQILQHVANLGFGMAGGLGQAASTGGSTIGGLGSGLILGNQINAQQAQRAEQERMKRLEWQFRAQEHEDKRAEMIRKQKALEAFGAGFNVAPQQGPIMGPTPTTGGMPTPVAPQGGDYDTRVAGLEGGTKKGGMVFNELGSGAFGPYQFMPATYAAVRAKNPQLNLPADMTQATREQWDQTHNAFKAENAQGLQAGGFQPTPENLYLAHRFGLGGATSVLRADPNKPLAEVLPVDWQRQNPDMRGQTAGGFRRLATERMGGSSVPYVVRPDSKPVQYGGPVIEQGDSIDTDSRPPAALTPVMPQPTWETPGDVMPVNPSAWFPRQQQPPAVPVPGGPPPAPGTPTGPGGPNVVQAQYQPQPGGPTMAPGGGPAPGGIDAPPTYVPPPVPRLDPQVEARINAGVAGGVITPAQGVDLKRQIVEDQYKKSEDVLKARHQAELKAWEARNQLSLEQYKIAEARKDTQTKLESELVPMRDRTTNEIKAVSKAEALRGAQSGQLVPLDASKEAREEAAAALAAAKDKRDAAQAAVGPDGRPQQGPIDAKAAAAAAEAKARADVEMQNKPALQFAEKEVARFSETVQPQAEAASSGLPNLYEMKRLTEGNMATGPLVESRILAARTLDWLGIRDMPEGMVNTTEYVNRAAKGVISVLQTGALGKTQISEGDRKFVEKMAAQDVTVSKQELQRLVDIAIDASHKTLDQHGKGVDRIGRLIGDKVAKDYFRVDRQTYEDWKKDNPPPDKQGQPGTTAAPAPSMQPKTGDPLEGRTATGPNGQKVVRQNGQWVPVP